MHIAPLLCNRENKSMPDTSGLSVGNTGPMKVVSFGWRIKYARNNNIRLSMNSSAASKEGGSRLAETMSSSLSLP